MLYKVFKQFLIASALLLLFVSCGNNTNYDQQVRLPDDGWLKNEAVRFDVVITDTLVPYNFSFTMRHSTNYRYSNLYVFMTTSFPGGTMSRDTIEFVLADPAGQWLGNGWGKMRDDEIRLKSPLYFPRAGEYQFLIQQAMRTDTLMDIEYVGLRLVTIE